MFRVRIVLFQERESNKLVLQWLGYALNYWIIIIIIRKYKNVGKTVFHYIIKFDRTPQATKTEVGYYCEYTRLLSMIMIIFNCSSFLEKKIIKSIECRMQIVIKLLCEVRESIKCI